MSLRDLKELEEFKELNNESLECSACCIGLDLCFRKTTEDWVYSNSVIVLSEGKNSVMHKACYDMLSQANH